MLEEEDIPKSYSREEVNKISSHIFVTLRYRDEDPIVEKPGAIIIAKNDAIHKAGPVCSQFQYRTQGRPTLLGFRTT